MVSGLVMEIQNYRGCMQSGFAKFKALKNVVSLHKQQYTTVIQSYTHYNVAASCGVTDIPSIFSVLVHARTDEK
jgi:hypothetical protein